MNESSNSVSSTESRLIRERDFHNDRFTDETRTSQAKYYRAIQDCADDYTNRIKELAKDASVLEYGCATGEMSLSLAERSKDIVGIDISDVAIDKCNAIAAERGYKNATFKVMDAENLEFSDNSFDLVFGSGIIHHLDVEKSYSEIARVLKPGGIAIFKEPLGSNILINVYRSLTPAARTPDEHPLLKKDISDCEKYFSAQEVTHYGLFTLGSAIMPGKKLSEIVYKVTRMVDKALFKVSFFRWQCWYVLMELKK